MLTRTHAAFLRAINIGSRRLTMDELRAACEPLGFDEVATWQATGNIAFATDPETDTAALEARIAEVLEAELGFEVPTIVRTAEQVMRIGTDVPFTEDDVAATEGRVQVLFVRDEPAPAVLAEVMGHASDEDQLQWTGTELWWLPRAGVSDSSLRVGAIEEALGVTTMRTHRSVAGFLARHLS